MISNQKRKQEQVFQILRKVSRKTVGSVIHLITDYRLLITAAVGCLWWLTSYTQLLEVTSESLEGIHYLLVRKSTSINRGDIVAIQGHKPQYLEGSYIFTKRVLGLPGDAITKTKKGLTIKAGNGSFTITYPLLEKTKEDQPLTPLPFKTIPDNHLFVVGDHPRSFDSRYEEFGLVSMKNIWGKSLLCW